MPVKFTKEKFIEKARAIHMNKYSYDCVDYINNKTKVQITCHIHGNFQQSPVIHLSGYGCKKCSNLQSQTYQTKSIEKFIQEAKAIHNDYDYSNFNYINRFYKGSIICKTHGVFKQTPADHLRGRGCPSCGIIKMISNQLMTLSDFINQASNIHKNKYIYNLTDLQGLKRKIEIICVKHGVFLQRADNHLRGIGCPKCSHVISKPEIAWLDSLNIPNYNRHQVIIIKNKRLNVDAYVDTTNTAYEFYGDFWHGNPKKFQHDKINIACKKTFGELYNKTMAREKFLIDNGYNIISIWEDEFNLSVV